MTTQNYESDYQRGYTRGFYSGKEAGLQQATERFINMSWWQRLFYSW